MPLRLTRRSVARPCLSRPAGGGPAERSRAAERLAPLRRAIESLEPRLLLSVSKDANGYTIVTPSADSRLIYVSAAGNDTINTGLSADSPVQTVAKGRTLLRDGFPDQLLLRRGDTFFTTIANWAQSGRSADEPMVLGAYTDPLSPTIERPKIASGNQTAFATAATSTFHPQVSHLVLSGVAFEAHTRNYRQPPSSGFTTSWRTDGQGGTYGLNLLGPANDLLFEDCSFQYYRGNIAIQAVFGDITNVRIRRCLIADGYAPNVDHAGVTTTTTGTGIYAQGVNGLTLDENVFDHNGWTDDNAMGSIASIFNHNAYINSYNRNVVVTGNIIANAASHGIQLRPGGIVKDNLFIRNPIALLYGYVNGEVTPGGVNGEISGNVTLDDRDIAGQVRGWGLEIGNTRPRAADGTGGTLVRDNIYSIDSQATWPAIQLTYGTNIVNPQQEVGINDLTIEHNVVHGWAKGISLKSGFSGTPGMRFLGGLVVRNNDFQQTQKTPIVDHVPTFRPAAETWSGNRYNSQLADNGSTPWFKVGSTTMNLGGWSAFEQNPQAVRVSYPAPSRNVSTYLASIGAGATSVDAYVAAARRQSRLFYRPQYAAKPVLEHVKAGFGGQKVDVAAPAAALSPANRTVGGPAAHTFTVTWTDDNQVNAATIGSGNLRVTGPNGYDQVASLVSVTAGNSVGSTYSATYGVPAPSAAGWDAAASGTYTVFIGPNLVSDASGKTPAPGGAVGTFQVAIAGAAPIATLNAPDVIFRGNPATLNVTYASASSDPSAAYTAAVLADGPIGYWRMEEFSGTTLVDSSGNGRDGSYAGGYQLGQPGALEGDADSAVGFDGVTAFASLPAGPAFDVTSAVTLEAWFATTSNAEDQFITTKGEDSWYLQTNEGRVGVYFNDFSAATGRLFSPAVYNDGAFHHVAATYDGAAIRLYVDGALVNSVAASGPIATGTSPVAIGTRNGAQSWSGLLDEVAVYGSALTADRIAAHYNAGRGADSAPVAVGTLDSGDLLVTGPNGFSAAATFVGVDNPTDGSPRSATYTVSPPLGGWSAAGSGTYTVSVRPDHVYSTAGVPLAAGPLGTFIVNVAAPTATVTAADVSNATAGAAQSINVTYRDDLSLNLGTIDSADLRILGPNGFNSAVTYDPTSLTGGGTTASARYTLAAPAGGWTTAHHGTYYVVAQADQVLDDHGSALPAGTVGAFQVYVDATPPVAFGRTSNVTTASSSTKTVTVTYSDPSGIDATSVGAGDIVINGPSGSGIAVTPAFQAATVTGTVVTATYTFAPPTGTWNQSQNGTYTITMQAGSVRDTPQNAPSVPRSVGTFTVVVDVTPPTAAVSSAPDVTTPATTATFTVNYTDNIAVDVSTIDAGDVRVLFPNGANVAATLLSVSSTSDGTPRTATYSVAAPAGVWRSADNGFYTIILQSGQVADTSNNFAPGGTIGTFRVALETTPPSGQIVSVTPDPRFTPVDAVTVTFTEPVTGFDVSDLVLSRDGGPNLLAGSGATLTTPDNVTFTIGNLSAATTPVGTYALMLNASGTGIADAAGNAIGAGASTSFTVTAAPAPFVQIIAVNGSAPQRSAVTTVTVIVNTPVFVDPAGFTVVGRNGAGAGAAVTVSNPSDDGQTYHLTFAGPTIIGGSLPDGVYDLVIRAAAVRTAAGTPMAADATLAFHRLFSDADGDGDGDNTDLFAFRGAYGKAAPDPAYSPIFDHDADGDVDNADLLQVRSRRGVEFKGY